MVKEFENIFTKFSSYSSADTPTYSDPFKLAREVPANMDDFSKKRLEAEIKELQQKTETPVYKLSVNAVQLQQGLTENKWYFDSSVEDNAKHFIKYYDINGDGRLSPRELILGSIHHNRNILGGGNCQLCYDDLVDKIDGVFAFLDCDNDGLVSSEDIFTNLRYLRRSASQTLDPPAAPANGQQGQQGQQQQQQANADPNPPEGDASRNYFALADKARIRTAVSNDFVLKNNLSIIGKLSKPEFRVGVLLGFWDRQTDDYKILKGDEKTLKELRWKDGVDIKAKDYIVYIEQQLRLQKEREVAAQQTKVSIDVKNDMGASKNFSYGR
jgi:hypothetical protein